MDGLSSGGGGGAKRMIYVGGLAEEVDEKVLEAAFVPFGDIVEVCTVFSLSLFCCRYF